MGIGSTTSKSFPLLKCITVLAKKEHYSLELTKLCEELGQTVPDLNEQCLTDLCLQNPQLLSLVQDSRGDMVVKLKPVDAKAAGQLLRLGSNVTVCKRQHQMPTGEQAALTVWVSASTVVLDGLQGIYYPGEIQSSVVFDCDHSKLNLSINDNSKMIQLLPKSSLALVTFSLKMSAVSCFDLQVVPLSLTVHLANGQDLRVIADQKFIFNEKIAVRISPDYPREELDSGMRLQQTDAHIVLDAYLYPFYTL